MTATYDQIVQKFLTVPYLEMNKTGDAVNVDEDTYINGCILHLDRDYEEGYLLEVVERDTKVISFVVVVTHPFGHDSMFFDEDCGTFYERNHTQEEIASWGLIRMYGLLESANQARRVETETHD